MLRAAASAGLRLRACGLLQGAAPQLLAASREGNMRGCYGALLSTARCMSSDGSSSDAPAPAPTPAAPPAVYVVFGAGGGIGSALIRRLAAEGAQQGGHVVAVGHSKQQADLLTEELGPQVHPMAADAVDPHQVESVLHQVLAQLGKVDGVANCVGSVLAQPAASTALSDLQATLATNLYTSFNIVKAAAQAMTDEKAGGRGGSIVLVSAAVAELGLPNYEAMSAAKAGVEGLARSAAAGCDQRGVRVNCVAPGLTRTRQTQSLTQPGSPQEAASRAMHPMKQLAEPQDIASALDFFLRPENNFITGQVLAVDGGLTTLHPHHPSEYAVDHSL